LQQKCGFKPYKLIKLPTPDGGFKDGIYNILDRVKFEKKVGVREGI